MKNTETSSQNSSAQYNALIGTSVIDRHGSRAHITSLYQKEGATVAVLATEDGHTIDADLSDFERHEGAFFTPLSLDGRNEKQESAAATWHEELNIPVAEEQIHVDKRSVETGKGIRVTKQVLEHDEIVNVPYIAESLSVKHVEGGQIVSADSLPQPRQEGDTYIIPVFEEIYVLEKKIRLKEEIHIIRERKETKENQKVRLRSEQVAIERFDENASRD